MHKDGLSKKYSLGSDLMWQLYKSYAMIVLLISLLMREVVIHSNFTKYVFTMYNSFAKGYKINVCDIHFMQRRS